MIKIEDLIPLLKEGWVAMDECGLYVWYDKKPVISKRRGLFMVTGLTVCPLDAFDITPADDWTKSLIKIERKKDVALDNQTK